MSRSGLFGASAEADFARLMLAKFRYAWAYATSGAVKNRPDERKWFEALHSYFNAALEIELLEATSGSGFRPHVESAVVHGGRSFAVQPFAVPWTCVGETAEVGDLLFVVSVIENGSLAAREAILLQIKVGRPHISDDSTHRELALYADWPDFRWANARMNQCLDDAGSRCMRPESTRAAQVAIVPIGDAHHFGTFGVERDPFGDILCVDERSLAEELAAVLNLNLGIDANYFHEGDCRCWPRIVDDMLTYAVHLRDRDRRDKYRSLLQQGVAPQLADVVERYASAHLSRLTDEDLSSGTGPPNRHTEEDEQGDDAPGRTVVASITFYDGDTGEQIPTLARHLIPPMSDDSRG